MSFFKTIGTAAIQLLVGRREVYSDINKIYFKAKNISFMEEKYDENYKK